MINYRPRILLLIVLSLAVGKVVGVNARAKNLSDNSESFLSSSIDSKFVSPPFYAQLPKPCQKLGPNYKKLHGFLTHNFYIGICARGEKLYYYRYSKSNPKKNILVKATPVLGGKVFKATKGKITYFIGRNSDGYYSSVMQPNHEILVEPEVKSKGFNLNIEEILNMVPALTEPTEVADFICSTEGTDWYIKKSDRILNPIEENSKIGEKDAILYSLSCF